MAQIKPDDHLQMMLSLLMIRESVDRLSEHVRRGVYTEFSSVSVEVRGMLDQFETLEQEGLIPGRKQVKGR